MKILIFIGIITGLFIGCNNDESEGVEGDINRKLIDIVFDTLINKQSKDTGFNKRIEHNKFQNDSFGISIDKKLTNKIQGEWRYISNFQLEFLSTILKPNYKVIFSYKKSKLITSWGELNYKSSARFYDTESSSYVYEYFVKENKQLIITQFDYYNNDITLKDKPELKSVLYSLKLINDSNLVISDGLDTYKFKKIRN
jgi:hypothetical protein